MITRIAALVATALVAVSSAVAQDGAPPAAAGQDAVEWDEVVRTAVEHRRFAVRRAAAGKAARAADAAVPAILGYQAEHGQDAFPLEFIDAIATAETTGPATEALLEAWAADREFYWRAQALGGLARRAVARCLPLFRAAVEDPSHLFRIEGARGLLAASTEAGDVQRVHGLLVDEDPRTRLRVALMALEVGDRDGVGEIVAAVDRAEQRFMDDAWGAREALFALRELRRISGEDFTDAIADDAEVRGAARAALEAWAREARPGPESARDASTLVPAVGGLEVRSCRNGDLFIRWTAVGEFVVGLDPVQVADVPAPAFAALRDRLPALEGLATHGQVICDYIRLVVPSTADTDGVEVHHKAAPSALPEPIHEWLKTLAAGLDESGAGARLRDRLGQFAVPDRNK